MASKIKINLDTNKENYLVAKCKQNDDITLEATIYENGLSKYLDTSEITIQGLKADNTYIIQDTDISKESNVITANLNRDFTRIAGTTKIEIVLRESGKQNTTFSFYLEVVGSVINKKIESENTVTILETLSNKVVEAVQVKEETEQLIQSGGAATKGDIETVNSQLAQTTKELVSKINEVAETGTTVEAIQSKVETMAQKGLIQAYTLGDKTIEPKKTTFFNTPENLYKDGDITLSGTGQWEYKNVTITLTPKITTYTFIIDSIVNCGYIDALNFQVKNSSNTIIYTKKIQPSTIKQYFEYFDASGVGTQIFIQFYRSQGSNPPNQSTIFSGIQLYDIPYNNIKNTLKREFFEDDVKEVVDNKINKVQSRNLIDFNNLSEGYYIDNTGGLKSAQYILPHWYTDYINVKGIKNIVRKIKKSTPTYLAFYDKDKNFISNSYYQLSGSEFEVVVDVPLNAIYCRFSFGRMDTILQSGVIVGNYDNSKKLYPSNELEPYKSEIVLPTVINVAKNIDFNLYYKNIINYINSNIFVSSENGNSYRRLFKYKPSSVNPDFNIYLNAYDNNTNIIADKKVTIKTIDTSKLSGKNLNILCVGDSFTDIGQWVKRLNDNLVNCGAIPNFIGTKVGNSINLKREFKSGGKLNEFVTNSNVNSWWDSTTQTNNIQKYLTDNNLNTPDILIIQFTWNDLPFHSEKDYSYMINDIKTLSSLFKAVNPNLKVIFSIEPMGAIEFNNQNTYLKNSAVLSFTRALLEEFNGIGDYSYIHVAPSYAWVDRINGYNLTSINFDHFTNTENVTGDSVHCNQGGMYQIGDCIFSLLSTLI